MNIRPQRHLQNVAMSKEIHVPKHSPTSNENRRPCDLYIIYGNHLTVEHTLTQNVGCTHWGRVYSVTMRIEILKPYFFEAPTPRGKQYLQTFRILVRNNTHRSTLIHCASSYNLYICFLVPRIIQHTYYKDSNTSRNILVNYMHIFFYHY